MERASSFADFVNGLPFDIGFRPGGYNDRTIMHATALADGGQDYLIMGAIDNRSLFLYDYTTLSAVATPLALGRVGYQSRRQRSQ
jgi:hypothetical protein